MITLNDTFVFDCLGGLFLNFFELKNEKKLAEKHKNVSTSTSN